MAFVFPRFKIPAPVFTLCMAVLFTSVLNISFWRKMWAAIEAEQAVPTGFILSLPVAMLAAFYIIFSVFSFLRLEKIIFPVLILLSAVANFSMFTYGILIDNNMIANIMETTQTEASGYLNASFAVWFFLTGVIPTLFVLLSSIERPPFKKDLRNKLLAFGAAALVMAGIGALYSVEYMTVMRNNKGIEKSVVPTYYLSSTYKYFKRKYVNDKIPFTKIGQDATHKPAGTSPKKDVMVFVLGETARAQNYALNGYNRATNPYTKELGVISFENTSSCGTATAVSVPCMFSFMGRTEYKEALAKKQSNVMDVLAYAGLRTLWIENDEGCKDVCLRTPTILSDKGVKPFCDGNICRDDALLADMDTHIKAASEKGGVIVVHIMGSHGPTYYKRYPQDMAAFKPDCPRSDIQNCGLEEIINTYDNTIVFTDYIVAQIIQKLKSHDNIINPALMYMSDHGESLGENGIYLHGMPYAIAPKEQTHVPFLVWLGDQTVKTKKIDLHCLSKNAKHGTYSHDFLSHSLLGFMDVSTSLYKPALDIFKLCRQPK